MLDQYERLRKRNAFLEQYKKFDDIITEFEDARAICDDLQKEYKSCETSDYASYRTPAEEAQAGA